MQAADIKLKVRIFTKPLGKEQQTATAVHFDARLDWYLI